MDCFVTFWNFLPMRQTILLSVCVGLLAAPLRAPAQGVALGLRVAPGFEVTEFADGKLANDIFNMTLDPRGRVVVSGPGYIRILVADAHNRRAERAIDVAGDLKQGAQGLLWEGSSLYFTGDGGLRRYHVKADGRADGPSELIRAMKTGGEHASHALRRGPDGWLYVLCGNMSGIDRTYAQLPTSPVREPIAGCVLRFTPDLKKSEIVADGFRNPYGMDFNPDGEWFTFDSDNERCVSLPWYEFTRFYHVIPGGHYGWQAPQRAQFWRFPPYFCDVVAPIRALGRGSPTGVACYRHAQFPPPYRGGLFLLDWTFGRVYFVSLQRSGSSYTCRSEVFLEAVGDNGFAPTACVVHPETGDLYISIGGRGTRGAVYRVRYPAGLRTLDRAEAARWQGKSRSLDWQPGLHQELLAGARKEDAQARLQALVALHRHRAHFEPREIQEAILANAGHPDRYIRRAVAELLGSLEASQRQALAPRLHTPLAETTYCLADYRDPDVLARVSRLLAARELEPEVRLTAVRLLELALGGLMSPQAEGTVWEGYSARARTLPPHGTDAKVFARALALVRDSFPAGQADLDRELTRTLAMLEDDDPALLTRVAARLTADSDPVEDVHYLIVLARLRGPRSAALTQRVAAALLTLDDKLTRRHRNRDRHWPLRVAELHAELAHKDSALNPALLAAVDFGRPDHVLFTRCPGFDRRRAAEIFLARAAKEQDYPWNPALVALIGSLPEEQCLPVLRRLWDQGGFEEAILPVLARHPRADDRDKFLQGLASPQLAVVRRCLEALEKLPSLHKDTDVLRLVRAFRRLPDEREAAPLRERFAAYLARVTAQDKLGASKDAWTAWFARTHPALAAQVGGADGVDLEAWNRRLAKLDWSVAAAEPGRAVFLKAGCASCHSGAQALGPDLHGVAGRFSRDDLFTAILQPSRDISPRYRTTFIATADGKTYQGLIIYEAVDSLILQTGPANTVRVVNSQITARRTTDISLMPAGLLDKLSDRDIADLYAYLKSMDAPPRAGQKKP